jgi:hypothetical protein
MFQSTLEETASSLRPCLLAAGVAYLGQQDATEVASVSRKRAMQKQINPFLESDDVLSWGRVVREKHYLARPQFRDEIPELLTAPGWESKLAIGLRRSYGNSCL